MNNISFILNTFPGSIVSEEFDIDQTTRHELPCLMEGKDGRINLVLDIRGPDRYKDWKKNFIGNDKNLMVHLLFKKPRSYDFQDIIYMMGDKHLPIYLLMGLTIPHLHHLYENNQWPIVRYE